METLADHTVARLREDIIVRKHEGPDGVRYVVKDPVTGRFFRFGELEGFILERLDGKASFEALRKQVDETFNLELEAQTLDQFAGRLKNCGILADGGPSPAAPPVAKRVQGTMLYLRIKLVDPDRFLGWLNSFAGFVFSRSFVLVSGAAIALALWIAATEWGAITRSFSTLFNSMSLATAWVIVLLVVFIHEISHGLACKRFGGKVHEMGFLLLYFMPAFYCNVSDAWLFPEKSKRIIVTLAGAYSEILIWSCATIGWLIFEPNTFVHSAGLVVMATSGVKTLFNMNPLIKLDGYYILSDYLDIHNLRWRAFSHLGRRIRGMWNPNVQFDEVTRRDGRIFIVFGILSALYTFWIISFFAWDFGAYLISTYQAAGFVVFTLFLSGILKNPVKKLFQRPSWIVPGVDPPKRRFTKPIRIALVGGVIIGAMFLIPMEMKVSGDFVILPEHNADIQAEVDGFVSELFVKEGDVVERGDPIALLSNRELRSSYEQKKAETEAALANLKLIVAGPTREEIALARAQLGKAEEQFMYARKDMDRNATLFERNLIARSEFEKTQELVAVRQKEVDESASKLKSLTAGSRPEKIQAQQAEVNQLRAELGYLESQIEALTVKSPIGGVVTTHMIESKIGQNVGKGELVAEVHNLTTVTAELLIPEKEIPNVQLGQAVVLKARAYPTVSFVGRVNATAPIATRPEFWYGGPVVLVQARLENTEGLLRSGMTGVAKIYCGERRMIDGVLHKILHFIRVDVWSWW